MPWLQLIADTQRSSAESIENALLKAGAASVTLQEHIPAGAKEDPILEPSLGETPLWDHARITGLFSADCNTEQINGVLSEALSTLSTSTSTLTPNLRWEQLEDKDWEREWMDNYHPIQCGDSLWICPSWQSPPNPSATNVLLDPGLAFGTGTHPTTFLCMKWLATQNLNNKTVIDYGCGSGILGIASLLLGAKSAVGIDIDPQALIATQDNVLRNSLSVEQFPVYLPQENKTITPADLVLANILAGPLVELADTLLAHLSLNGKICLSGVLVEQADKVIEAYQEYIEFEPIQQKEEWVQLAGRRIS
ncbi:MAG: 50S ribosomal protein L11 methyltransferase [Cellvibrionaceae bacterium]